MNIGIDIDDTISETFETLLPYAQKFTIEQLGREAKIDFNKKCINHYYIEEMFNWSREESVEFWGKYITEILEKVNIKTFASDIINKLKKNGNNIYLITARANKDDNNVRETTIKWLKDNNVIYDELFINAEADRKVQIVEENKIDIFIDDSYENCKDVSDKTNAKVYMMNTRVNEKFSLDENINRVYSWLELEHLINKKGEN